MCPPNLSVWLDTHWTHDQYNWAVPGWIWGKNPSTTLIYFCWWPCNGPPWGSESKVGVPLVSPPSKKRGWGACLSSCKQRMWNHLAFSNASSRNRPMGATSLTLYYHSRKMVLSLSVYGLWRNIYWKRKIVTTSGSRCPVTKALPH